MGHLRRLVTAGILLVPVFIFAIFLDAAVAPIVEIAYQMGVDEGVFAPVLEHADRVRWLLVPGLIIGIVLWYLYGTVQQERREEQYRRLGPP